MERIRIASRGSAIALAALAAGALVFAGCGGDDETTTDTATQSVRETQTTTTTEQSTSTGASDRNKETRERIDSAVADCDKRADELGSIAGSAVSAACEEVGNAFKRNLDDADESVDKALADAAKSCRNLADNLPSGSARDALDSLCEAISSER